MTTMEMIKGMKLKKIAYRKVSEQEDSRDEVMYIRRVIWRARKVTTEEVRVQ